MSMWEGIPFTRRRIVEWAAAQCALGWGIQYIEADGRLVTLVPPRRYRTGVGLDHTDPTLGQSAREQIVWCKTISEHVRYCKRCASYLPATRDYFHVDRKGQYGLRSVCKTCVSNRGKRQRTHSSYQKVLGR